MSGLISSPHFTANREWVSQNRPLLDQRFHHKEEGPHFLGLVYVMNGHGECWWVVNWFDQCFPLVYEYETRHTSGWICSLVRSTHVLHNTYLKWYNTKLRVIPSTIKSTSKPNKKRAIPCHLFRFKAWWLWGDACDNFTWCAIVWERTWDSGAESIVNRMCLQFQFWKQWNLVMSS